MAQEITGKKVAQSVTISLAVQVVSLAVGFLLNLIVPKFIEIQQYAHWQTYVLYVSYVGVLHFGLLDGIVLRYSKYDYEELDKPRIRSQFKILLFTTALMSIIGVILGAVISGVDGTVVILVSIGIVTKNLYTYNSFSFQITNRIKNYAIVVLSQRLTYGVIVIGLLVFGVGDYYLFCIADLLGDIVASVISLAFNKGMYLGKDIGLKEGLKEYKVNLSAGVILLFANWSSMLLSGGAKMFIEWRFDSVVFANVAFAFSVSNFMLSFVTAVSVVLFPSLKRMNEDKLPETYQKIRAVLTPLLVICLTAYFPAKIILEAWVPQYADSLTYIGVILPMIIFSSKVSLLTNNYLKVYRKEKFMLVINIVSVLIAFIAFSISAYALGSELGVIISLIVCVFINATLSEIVVYKTIDKKMDITHLIEPICIAGFILTVLILPFVEGLLAWAGILIVYLVINILKNKSILIRRKK